MKRLLLIPLCVAVWVSTLPTHYRTVSYAHNRPGSRFELLPAHHREVDIYIRDHGPGRTTDIRIGAERYQVDSAIHYNDSLDAYQCHDMQQRRCSISFGATCGEAERYRIIIVYDDALRVWKAN